MCDTLFKVEGIIYCILRNVFFLSVQAIIYCMCKYSSVNNFQDRYSALLTVCCQLTKRSDSQQSYGLISLPMLTHSLLYTCSEHATFSYAT